MTTIAELVADYRIRKITEDRDRWRDEAVKLERILMSRPLVNYNLDAFVNYRADGGC